MLVAAANEAQIAVSHGDVMSGQKESTRRPGTVPFNGSNPKSHFMIRGGAGECVPRLAGFRCKVQLAVALLAETDDCWMDHKPC